MGGGDSLFTEVEAAAILETNLYAKEKYKVSWCPYQDYASRNRLFLLSAWEAATLYENDEARKKTNEPEWGWWLRSAGHASTIDDYDYAGACDDGALDSGLASVNNDEVGVCPAFNLDTAQALFTSTVSWDKSKALTSGAVSQVSEDTKEWKVTLLDQGKSIACQSDVTIGTDGEITVPYTYTDSNAQNKVNQLSVMVTDQAYGDDDAKILYYGALQNIKNEKGENAAAADAPVGTGTFQLPDSLPQKYRVYLLAESVNSGNYTDYASRPMAVNGVGGREKLMNVIRPADITAANGISLEALLNKLPSQVPVSTEENSATSMPAVWDTDEIAAKYRPDVRTEQIFTVSGTVTCPDNIDPNHVPLSLEIQVTISAAEKEEPPTPPSGTERPTTGPTSDTSPSPETPTKPAVQLDPKDQRLALDSRETPEWVRSNKVDEYTRPEMAKPLKTTGNSVKISWTKVKGAKGYIIYGAPCGSKIKKIAQVSAKKTTYTQKKRTPNKWYKYKVVAYKIKRGKKVAIGKTLEIHAITATKNGKYGNPVKVKVSKKNLTITKGKTKQASAKVIMAKGKKLRNHVKPIRWISSNQKIASVNKKGQIKAKKKGRCVIFAVAQNGVRGKVTVRVK